MTQKMDYVICLKTGDRENAGTDAKIQLKLSGSEGTSELVKKPDLPGNDLERNTITAWVLTHASLGELDAIYVKSDCSGDQAGWYLEQVIIAEMNGARGKSWVFPVDTWITKKTEYKFGVGAPR